MKKNIFIIITFFLLSCDAIKDCEDCFTPPNNFYFDIVDKVSGENLFTNGTYDYQDIEIINTLDGNESVDFEFITHDNINQIEIYSIGYSTEIVNLKFYVSNQYLFDFYVDAERTSENCCSFTVYNEIKITGSDFVSKPQSGVYTILVE
ncbi:hypothetical protein KO493_08025 [Tamlana agarivorans]|uniref:Uncharacterized protein n=1 Tax=Pseudotamlana agarivorans TaxID=481183 RepID=A0ACC5U8P1_9FLAO|nr:hypothetical protein [Tamlana agarivorans]MBU2950640.1 hypothetical protein [Tamlana agarivorans]